MPAVLSRVAVGLTSNSVFLAKGSLSEVSKPCVRKECKACAEGRGHRATIYTHHEGRRLRCMHVRPGFVPELRRAIENGRKLEAVLVRLGRARAHRARLRAGAPSDEADPNWAGALPGMRQDSPPQGSRRAAPLGLFKPTGGADGSLALS